MGLLKRIEEGPQAPRLPANVIPFEERRERRAQARWIERKNHIGLPDKDYTGHWSGDAA